MALDKDILDNALRVIRAECKSHSVCKDCPLRRPDDNGFCYIKNGYPENWRLKSDSFNDDGTIFR